MSSVETREEQTHIRSYQILIRSDQTLNQIWQNVSDTNDTSHWNNFSSHLRSRGTE